jgi:hypothetical protein
MGKQARADIEALPPGLVDGLREPTAYPLDPGAANGVASVQTHISHVFLTESRVYKLRKAVDLGFLDFSTRRIRNSDCLREVALNRRLASDVYLGLAPLVCAGGAVRVGAVQESVSDPDLEYCVVMRRLPKGRDSVSLIERGAFGSREVDRIAQAVVGFHQRYALGRPAPFQPIEWLEAISKPVEDNFTPMVGVIAGDLIDRLADLARRFLRTHRVDFEKRRIEGRVVDGHGDLHLAHVWFETDGGSPLFIDCIEFSDQLRYIDAASEVAFLAMDLRYRGHADLAERFLRRYASESDDFHLYCVVDYFSSYRAAVRAKVAAIAAGESELPETQRRAARESARRHFDLASDALGASRRAAVILMAGIVGTGKSTAANAIAEVLDAAVVVSSDRVRKHLAGIAASDHGGSGVDGGIYSPEFTQRVYTGLLERSEPVADSGRVVVLDATFSRRDDRARAVEFARARGLPVLIVETRSSRVRTIQRLEERARDAKDPSDAGPEFHAASAARFAPIEKPAAGDHIVVDTEWPSWRRDLQARVRDWRRVSLQGNPTRLERR